MGIVLYDFQKEDEARMEAMGLRGMLGHEQGLGKTCLALKLLANHPELRPAIIVAPASLKLGWEDMARRLFGMKMDVLSGKGPKGKGTPWFIAPQIVCINYDVLEAWLPWLLDIKAKIVIADEVQAVRNYTSKRAKALKTLVKGVPHLIAASGTPMANRPIEFWSILNMLAPKEFPNYQAFGMRYGRGRRTPWGWNFNGASNLKELHKRTAPLVIRRLKADVLKDLPPKTRSMVPLEFIGKAKKEYDSAKNDLIAWLKTNYGPGVANKASKVEAIAKVAYLRRLVAELKMPQTIEWINDFLETGEKLIAFTVHKATAATLTAEFKDRCVTVTGATPSKDRFALFKKFNEDPKCELLIGNWQAAGAGWSANACSNVAAVEYPWAPGDILQGEARCHGIGRGQVGLPTNAHWLAAQGTIEIEMCEMLAEKAKNLDAVMDGRTVDRLDVFDDVANSLMRGKR